MSDKGLINTASSTRWGQKEARRPKRSWLNQKWTHRRKANSSVKLRERSWFACFGWTGMTEVPSHRWGMYLVVGLYLSLYSLGLCLSLHLLFYCSSLSFSSFPLYISYGYCIWISFMPLFLVVIELNTIQPTIPSTSAITDSSQFTIQQVQLFGINLRLSGRRQSRSTFEGGGIP